MKKAYAALISVLIAVVVLFTFAKVHLSHLKTGDAMLKQELRRQQLVDSLHQTHRQMLTENRADLQVRFDSLCAESNAMIYALESQLDLYINSEYDPLEQSDSLDMGTRSARDRTQDEADLLSPTHYQIYIEYLEMVMHLPKDLSPYEKQVEVREIKNRLTKRFSIDGKELEDVLVRMRERGKTIAESR